MMYKQLLLGRGCQINYMRCRKSFAEVGFEPDMRAEYLACNELRRGERGRPRRPGV